jgi:flagellar hook-associated protein 3 FlgL
MRIADKMKYNQVYENVHKNRSEMYDLQNQAATQKRINKPSDDPLSATRVLGARTEERGNSQFIKNITNVKSFLEFTDQSLAELSDSLVRAKELALAQSTDAGASDETRRVTANEVSEIFHQAVQIGNRKLGERFIFGGFKTQDNPFNNDGEYLGDQGEMKIQTHKDTFMTMNLPGSKVFHGKHLGGDGIVRALVNTPKTPEELNERLNVEKQVAEKNKESESPLPQDNNANHYNRAGQKGEVIIRGPADIGTSGQVGKEDPTTKQNGVNIFQTLRGLEVSLRTNDKQGIQDTLEVLDQAISQVVLARSEVGARIMAVDAGSESLRKAVVDNKAVASQLEDADVFQVVSDINKTDSALKATLEVSPKLIQTSLLDFLR